MKYYFTLAENQGGPGCVEVEAEDYESARTLMCTSYGTNWAFQYESLEDVHPYDRTILDTI